MRVFAGDVYVQETHSTGRNMAADAAALRREGAPIYIAAIRGFHSKRT